ncbi:transcription factor S [Nanoarchaeota archaeon]
MFCPKCGAILMPKKDSDKKKVACNSCGYSTSEIEGMKIKEEVQKTTKDIEVMEDTAEQTLPKSEADCPGCGHKEAYYWLVQTRAGDEPETRFFRCTKCKKTWRENV